MRRPAPIPSPTARSGFLMPDRLFRGPGSRLGWLRSSLRPSGRLLLPVLLATAAAGPALAQSIPVRAGEHEDFTRLVVGVPEDDAWTLVPAPGGFELRGPAEAAFDTDEVFGRIPRDRIAALDVRAGGRLGIAIACDCHGEVFWEPEVGFVLDVIDGPAPPGAVAPWPAAPARPGASALPLLTEVSAPPLLPGAWDVPLATPAREAARVARTEAAILDSVAEAARHGFLDLAPGVEAAASAPEEEAAEEPRPDPNAVVPAAGQPGLALRTGAEVIGPDKEPLGATGTACLSEDDLDLASWAGTGDFGTEVAARTAALTDARDQLDPAAAEALARAYLAFGFGREARLALDLDGRSSRGRDVLRHVAHLLDGEPVPPLAFEDQAGCLGPVALWRALARGTLRGTDERERTAVTLALRALPSGPREAVTLRLAGLFLDAGDAAGAEAMAVQGGGTEGEALLPRAAIAEEVDGPAAALVALEEAADQDPRMTPEALAELLDLLVDEGRAVDADLLELARALRFEHGGSRALLLAEARALTADGHFEEALVLLDSERPAAPGPDLDAALASTVETLTIELADGPFLELALGGLPRHLPPEAAEAVARRLSNLGFPDEAWALRMEHEAVGHTRATAAEAPAGDSAVSRPVATTPAVEGAETASDAFSRLASASEPSAAVMETSQRPDGRASLSGIAIPPPPPLAETPEVAAVARPAPTSEANAASASLPPDALADVPEPRGSGLGAADMTSDPAAALVAQAAEPAPAIAAPVMSLADRRTLLLQAEDARARAAALLGQELSD